MAPERQAIVGVYAVSAVSTRTREIGIRFAPGAHCHLKVKPAREPSTLEARRAADSNRRLQRRELTSHPPRQTSDGTGMLIV